MELIRQTKFGVKLGIISQFQLGSEYRHRRIKTIISKDYRKLKFQYTDLSGYITICEDIEEIIVLWE